METQREHVGKLVYDALSKIIGRREGMEITYKITFLDPEKEGDDVINPPKTGVVCK